MAIDYVTDIRSLYTADVEGDVEYGIETNVAVTCPDCKVETARADHVSEQDILTTMAVVEAHIRLLRDRDEARVLHYTLARLLKGIGSGGFVFEDLGLDVVGSKPNPVFAAGDDIEVVDAAGANIVTVTLSTAPFNVQNCAIDMNAASLGALGAANIVARVNANNQLVLTMDDGSLAASPPPPAVGRRYAPGFGIGSGGANNNVTRLAGLEIAQYKNRLDELADRLRDDALAIFQNERREDDLEDYFRRDPQRG